MLMMLEQSLPVAFGAETAKWICVAAIDITQISVAGMSLEFISDRFGNLMHLSSGKFNSSLRILMLVAGYLLGAGKPYYSLALLALIIPQVVFQVEQLLDTL